MKLLLKISCLSLLCCNLGCNNEAVPLANSDTNEVRSIQKGRLTFVQDSTTGYQLASLKQKPCLLFFTADWCTYCHRMEESAFADEAVAELAEEFICVMIDADREQAICKEFEVTGFPTVQFISQKGQRLHKLIGVQSASDLAIGMKLALERTAWIAQAESHLR